MCRNQLAALTRAPMVMAAHQTDSIKAGKWGALALANLAANPSNRLQVVGLGGVAALVELARKEVMQHLQMLLSSQSWLLTRALSLHDQDEPAQAAALAALRGVAATVINREIIVAEGIMDPLVCS